MSTQALVTAEMAKCVDALRMQLFAKGEFGLGKLTGAFAQVDYDGSGNVTRQDFNDVLNYCGLFCSEQNLTTVQKFFAPNPNACKITATIPISGFVREMLVPLTPRRRAMVAKAWVSLGGGDTVDTRAMLANFKAAGHVYVRQGSHTAEDIMDQFASGFEGPTTGKAEFEYYYTDLSAAIPRDTFFVAAIEDTWLVKELEQAVNKKRILELNTLLCEKVRQKEKDGKARAVLLKYAFDFFDVDDANKLTRPEFSEACAHFGVQLTAKDLDDYFLLFAGGDGNIPITTFSQSCYNGDLEARVKASPEM